MDELMQMVTRTATGITMEDDGRRKGKGIWNLLVSHVFEDGYEGAGWVGECDVGEGDVPCAWLRRGC